MKSVEDEWERDIETTEDLDLLFVTYDSRRITVVEMMKTIRQYKFESQVKE